jgi:hypothetical protein
MSIPFPHHVHAAAARVRERDDAVDVGKGFERGAAVVLRDVLRDGRRAIHGGEDADVVARRHAAVGTNDALEGRGRRSRHRRLVRLAEGVVAGEVPHLEVVGVDVLPGAIGCVAKPMIWL